jgi:thioredoxin-related protein
MFINDAVKKAKKVNKLLIIEFWDPECISSSKLKEEIFENEENREFFNSNFLLVKVSSSDSVYTSLHKHFNLSSQNSCIFMDINGNEIDRAVSYDGNKDAFLSFLKDVAEGRNLYCQVFMAYKKDTTDIRNNFLLAKKLLFRYQLNEAVKRFNKVLLLDPDNKNGYNEECKLKIKESVRIIRADTTVYRKL